jgi:hypothetical protein
LYAVVINLVRFAVKCCCCCCCKTARGRLSAAAATDDVHFFFLAIVFSLAFANVFTYGLKVTAGR